MPKEFDVARAELRLLRKAETVLARRTSAVTVVLERLQDGHNYCAVLRTMEALGVQNVWVVSPPPMESKNIMRRRQAEVIAQTATTTRVRKRAQERLDNLWDSDAQEDMLHTAFAKSAQRWLTVREFSCHQDCVAALRAEGRKVWVTALEQRADVLAPGAPWLHQPEALPQRLAIVLGAEEGGVSEGFKKAADRLVYFPLCGFAESLNVSVAAALIVQMLLQMQRQAYSAAEMRLSPREEEALREDWYVKLARTPKDREVYVTATEAPPAPLDDLRRPDSHRVVRYRNRHKRD
jgi:tRNA (guanosine-2'-O-)-methyltransferase